MFINKVSPFATKEDDITLSAYYDAENKYTDLLDAIYQQMRKAQEDLPNEEAAALIEDLNKQADEWLYKKSEIYEKQVALSNEVTQRYIDSLHRNMDLLLKDVNEILDNVTLDAYTDYIHNFKSIKKQKPELFAEGNPVNDFFNIMLKKNWKSAITYLNMGLDVQYLALEQWGYEADNITELVENKASTFVKRPKGKQHLERKYSALTATPNFLPMVYNNATDALARPSFTAKKMQQLSKFDKTSKSFVTKGVTITVSNYDDVRKSLSPSTIKLLDYMAIKLAEKNGWREKDQSKITTGIAINIKEYAELLGYDVIEKPMPTPEEQKAEKKRAKDALDNARKKLNKAVNAVYNLSVKWQGDNFTKPLDSRIITAKGEVVNGYMLLDYYMPIAKSLLQEGYITYLPKKAFALKDTNEYVYKISRKLAKHYSIENNIARKTNNIISIAALLAECEDSIPTYESLLATDNRGWHRNISDKLENVLDTLESAGIISTWEYCNSKKAPLTEEQLNTASYSVWHDMYIYFEMAEDEELKALHNRSINKTE